MLVCDVHYDPSAGDMEAGPWGLLGNQPHLLDGFCACERLCVGGGVGTSAVLHMLMYIHMYMSV